VHEKGKRKVVESVKVEQRCKFKTEPHVMKAALEIEAKRRQHDKRITQRKRDKQSLKEIEKEL